MTFLSAVVRNASFLYWFWNKLDDYRRMVAIRVILILQSPHNKWMRTQTGDLSRDWPPPTPPSTISSRLLTRGCHGPSSNASRLLPRQNLHFCPWRRDRCRDGGDLTRRHSWQRAGCCHMQRSLSPPLLRRRRRTVLWPTPKECLKQNWCVDSLDCNVVVVDPNPLILGPDPVLCYQIRTYYFEKIR